MTLIFSPSARYASIIFQENILSRPSRELGGENSRTQSGESARSVRERISDVASEKTQTLSAEFVSSGCWTTLPGEKELAAEIERTQVPLHGQKRIALTSPEAIRMTKSLKKIKLRRQEKDQKGGS